MYLDINQLTETFLVKILSSKSPSSTDHNVREARNDTLYDANLLVSLINI